jgi:hypothetical protein
MIEIYIVLFLVFESIFILIDKRIDTKHQIVCFVRFSKTCLLDNSKKNRNLQQPQIKVFTETDTLYTNLDYCQVQNNWIFMSGFRMSGEKYINSLPCCSHTVFCDSRNLTMWLDETQENNGKPVQSYAMSYCVRAVSQYCEFPNHNEIHLNVQSGP